MIFKQAQDLISRLVTSHNPWADQGRMALSILVIVVIMVVLLLSNRTRAVAMMPVRYKG